MTDLLQKAIIEIEKLPDVEQDAIAARILAEIEDEQVWKSQFEATTDEQWDELAEMVRQEIAELSTWEARLVLDYARTLQKTTVSKAGQTYLEMIASQGATPVELLRATQAVQRVEKKLAKTDPKTYFADLEKRTEEHMRHWLRERGMDYETITDEEFDEIVDEAVQNYRKGH